MPLAILSDYCKKMDSIPIETTEIIKDSKTNEDMYHHSISIESLKGEAYSKSRKDARQRAAQHLLKQLHPFLRTWKELELKYEVRKTKNVTTSKLVDNAMAIIDGPNLDLLRRLKDEMTKLKQQKQLKQQ